MLLDRAGLSRREIINIMVNACIAHKSRPVRPKAPNEFIPACAFGKDDDLAHFRPGILYLLFAHAIALIG